MNEPHKTAADLTQSVELTKLSRHPFQIWVMLAAIISGLPIFLGRVAPPNSLEEKLPHAGIFAWALLFAGGGVMAIIGATLRKRDTGLLVEQVGLGFVGSACLLYSGLLGVNAGWQAASVSIALLGSLAAASVWRFVDIQRTIRAVKYAARRLETRNDGQQ
jgi:hypothetical protein